MGLIAERGRLRRPDMRRVVVVLPSAFTLGNMFFGIWAIIMAARGNFTWAAWFIMFAGVLDMLDGRLARLSGTGTRFGAELDSLVDCISFGVAPAMIMYFLEFQNVGKLGWLICYGYVAAVALRLARYNVQHNQDKPGWFTGLPSPSAGMTLAVYYPFSQTEWYRASLAYLDLQREGLTFLMVVLSLLMVSTVHYPRFPAIGFRTAKGLLSLLLHLTILALSLWIPQHFLFPLGLAYLTFGIIRQALLSVSDHRAGDWRPGIVEGSGGGVERRTAPRLPGFRRGGGGKSEE